jgi:hypothetical protein
MDIVSEPLELEQIEAAVGEPAEIADIEELPEAKPKAKAKAKAKAKSKPRAVRPEPEPLPAPEVPVIAAPKAKTRKPPAPAVAPTYAPVPAPVAPGISDVFGMLATALLDQRQQRNAQRSAMYQAFLD